MAFGVVPTLTAAQNMMSDYRTVLYRLDLATSYPSIPALLQHFMDESPFDGTIEIRVVTAPSAGDPHIPTPPRSPGGFQGAPAHRDHHISFSRAENTRDVYARCTFGFLPDPQLNVNSSPTQRSAYVQTPVLAVTHEFPPKTPVAAAFIPIVDQLLRNDHDLASVIFECRSYVQAPPTEVENPLEVLDRAAPYKRMFGYVGRVRGGMTIYELDDTVTGTMFSTMTPTGFPLPT
ncbi:hypothetical protein RhiJN_06432 [Ceratobasidium sp. AG-Ba]|nr:hypothetical protein RhiJN_06432 [Ceratobasidium sp. AG-Ba]QRW07347.1 hypothetical protein RhiLY_06346 [Ceratobasidium sp. AG-Ba]